MTEAIADLFPETIPAPPPAEAISARRSALEQYDQRCLANSARAES